MVKRRTVLVIEDEQDISEMIQYNLERDGFRVEASRDGESGLRKAQVGNPDLILLDLMLPGVDGLEICRRIKMDPVTRSVPIIMVTAKGEESDVVLGLGVGADDYVTKPFSPRELLARVQAVLRRGSLREEQETKERLVRNGLVVDRNRHEVRVNGEPISMTATELRLLHFLASHPGRVFTRSHLVSRVIGEQAIVTDRNIDVHIRSVRQKLGECRDLIETVRGVGYRFRDSASDE